MTGWTLAIRSTSQSLKYDDAHILVGEPTENPLSEGKSSVSPRKIVGWWDLF